MKDFVSEWAERKPEWIEGKVSGIKLAVNVNRRHPKNWIVAIHGGHSESKRKGARWAHLNELAARWNWSFVAFDLRDEDGDSQPHCDATITQSLEDLDLIVDSLAPHDGRLVLWGHSRGGLLAFLWAATRHSGDACILVAPAFSSYARFLAYIKDQGTTEEQWHRDGVVRYTRWGKSQERTWEAGHEIKMWDEREHMFARSFRVPTLIIHSKRDQTVSYGYSNQFGDWCSTAQVRIVRIGDHQFRGLEPWLMTETEDYLVTKGIFAESSP